MPDGYRVQDMDLTGCLEGSINARRSMLVHMLQFIFLNPVIIKLVHVINLQLFFALPGFVLRFRGTG